jgi:hypothetical protein
MLTRDWPGTANPNPPRDRERELALRIFRQNQQSSTPDMLCAITQGLADYRRELTEGKS